MRCRTCGYRLRDLEANRCPECGRSFDPRYSSTFLAERERNFPTRSVLTWAILLLFLSSLAAIIFLAVVENPSRSSYILIPAFALPQIVPLFLIAEWLVKRRKFRE